MHSYYLTNCKCQIFRLWGYYQSNIQATIFYNYFGNFIIHLPELSSTSNWMYSIVAFNMLNSLREIFPGRSHFWFHILIDHFELHFAKWKTRQAPLQRKSETDSDKFPRTYAMVLISTHTSGASYLIYTNTCKNIHTCTHLIEFKCILSVLLYCSMFMHLFYITYYMYVGMLCTRYSSSNKWRR